MSNIIGRIIETVGGGLVFCLMALLPIGELYWLWMAFQLSSFWMFAMAFFPPTILVAAPVGAYSLIFGIPDWVIYRFG